MFIFFLACASEPAATVRAPASSSAAPVVAAAPSSAMREVTVQELSAIRSAGPSIVLDVRTAEEFAAGHVPGAVNIPLDQVEARIAEVPSSGEVHVICAAGGRSAKASSILAGKGISAINVKGGTNAWVAAGLVVEK